MNKILLEISYLGTNYSGYQVQPDRPTVQQKLNIAAKAVFGFECDIVGCSRTDSGVHANQFFVTVSEKGKKYIETTVPQDKIALAMSTFLPEDICVLSAVYVSEEFHPRYDVKYKEYMYCIWNAPVGNPFMYDRSWHYPRYIDDVAIERMRTAAALIVGTRDFSSFMAAGSNVSSTVRTVFDIRIERDGEKILFYIRGDGFLYNMVRIIVGTLIGIAEGKAEPEDIEKIIQGNDRSLAGQTAPACGLYLNKVVY